MAFTNIFIINISEWDFAKIFSHKDFTLYHIGYIVCIHVGHYIAIAMGLVKLQFFPLTCIYIFDQLAKFHSAFYIVAHDRIDCGF